MNTKEAAEYLKLSHWYLRNMRQHMHGWHGPSFTYTKGRGGNHCVYTKEGLDSWARSTADLRSKGRKGKRTSKKTQLADYYDGGTL